MKRILIYFLVLFGLVGCSSIDNKSIQFHNQSFNQFTYKGIDYTIMDKIVDEGEITSSDQVFFKTLVIDTKTQKIRNKSSSDTISLAYSGLYNLSDGLAISVNGSYYKVSLSSDLKSEDQRLNIEKFLDSSIVGQLAIDSSDCRIIHYNHRKYRISSELVSLDKLGEFLGVLADSKTFILTTGKEVSKSELRKIDYTGTNSDEEREVWNYGEVYSLNMKDTIAVEINDEYRIAYLD